MICHGPIPGEIWLRTSHQDVGISTYCALSLGNSCCTRIAEALNEVFKKFLMKVHMQAAEREQIRSGKDFKQIKITYGRLLALHRRAARKCIFAEGFVQTLVVDTQQVGGVRSRCRETAS